MGAPDPRVGKAANPRTKSIWPKPAATGRFNRRKPSGRRASRTSPGRERISIALCLARLEQEQLTPAPDADRVTLLRRVTFDLGWAAADAQRDRRLCQRQVGHGVGNGGQSAAGVAAIWRTLGAALAGRRPFRRIDRQGSQSALSLRLAISQLRDRRVSTKASRTTNSSSSSWRAICCRAKIRPSAIG